MVSERRHFLPTQHARSLRMWSSRPATLLIRERARSVITAVREHHGTPVTARKLLTASRLSPVPASGVVVVAFLSLGLSAAKVSDFIQTHGFSTSKLGVRIYSCKCTDFCR